MKPMYNKYSCIKKNKAFLSLFIYPYLDNYY